MLNFYSTTCQGSNVSSNVSCSINQATMACGLLSTGSRAGSATAVVSIHTIFLFSLHQSGTTSITYSSPSIEYTAVCNSRARMCRFSIVLSEELLVPQHDMPFIRGTVLGYHSKWPILLIAEDISSSYTLLVIHPGLANVSFVIVGSKNSLPSRIRKHKERRVAG